MVKVQTRTPGRYREAGPISELDFTTCDRRLFAVATGNLSRAFWRLNIWYMRSLTTQSGVCLSRVFSVGYGGSLALYAVRALKSLSQANLAGSPESPFYSLTNPILTVMAVSVLLGTLYPFS